MNVLSDVGVVFSVHRVGVHSNNTNNKKCYLLLKHPIILMQLRIFSHGNILVTTQIQRIYL